MKFFIAMSQNIDFRIFAAEFMKEINKIKHVLRSENDELLIIDAYIKV